MASLKIGPKTQQKFEHIASKVTKKWVEYNWKTTPKIYCDSNNMRAPRPINLNFLNKIFAPIEWLDKFSNKLLDKFIKK